MHTGNRISMGILIKLTWLIGLLLFIIGVGLLALSISTPLQMAALGILTGLIAVLTFMLMRGRLPSHHQYYPLLFQQIGPFCEVNLFDTKGHILLSTRDHAYLNLSDFTRKLFQKIHPSEASEKLQDALEYRKPCEVLVYGGGDGLGQFEKWWLMRVMVYQNYISVIILDVTESTGKYHQLEQNYKALEKFIDSAPFGLYYTSRSGHLVGLNATLANWFGQLKEEIIGRRARDVFAQEDESWVTLQTDPPLKLYRILNGSANLLFRMHSDFAASSQHNAGSIDDSFHKQSLPALKINRACHILDINEAFQRILVEHLDVNNPTLFTDIVAANQRNDIYKKIQRLFDPSYNFSPFEVRFGEDKIHTTAYAARLNRDQVLLQLMDISEQKRLEQQFIQSQKMQAVGQLAGGIAHDFNNLLTAMLGFCDLLLQRYIPSDPSYNDVMQIKQNATRAANLVRQLLAFSRQQNLQPKIIYVTDALAELTALLRRLIGASIDLQIVHGRDIWPIKVDGSQLEQVIINLVVNARDAMLQNMHDGMQDNLQNGCLTITTHNIHNQKVMRLGHDLMPKGDYVLIEVKDTGHGIEPEHLEHIFEPFFSTKEVGAGTGLGLSTVYGIVKQTGGFIGVESIPASMLQKPKGYSSTSSDYKGNALLSKLAQNNTSSRVSLKGETGTIFKIYLPRFMGEEKRDVRLIEQPVPDLTGGGRILLVEDEDAVRLFSARALREKGYTVVEAASGDDALNLLKDGKRFDLLVTDVVMPKMDGPTLAKKIKDYQADLKTIFISGYTEDTFRKNLGHDAKIHFLAKPFSLKDLALKVKDVLRD